MSEVKFFKHSEEWNLHDHISIDYFKGKVFSRLAYEGSNLYQPEFMTPVFYDGDNLLAVRTTDENKLSDPPYIIYYEFIAVENETYDIVNLYRGKNPLYKPENKN